MVVAVAKKKPRPPVRKRVDTGFGRKVRDLREARGWTQAELGERAGGMAHQSVAKYERGASEPTWSVVIRLADALGVPTDELIDREMMPPPEAK